MCPDKFQLYQIQNGWLSAIINIDVPDVWQTTPNNYLDNYVLYHVYHVFV